MSNQPPRNPYLCLTIVWLLGVTCMTSLLGIIVINVLGKEPHSSLIALSSGSLAALGTFLVQPPRHSVGYDDQPSPGRQPPPIVISPNQAVPQPVQPGTSHVQATPLKEVHQ